MHCQECKKIFQITPNDEIFYRRLALPKPTFCPPCRLRRRLAWRNEHSLYQRSCDLCNKTIISIYRPDSPYLVYCQPCWWSDQWEPRKYARDYDWSKDFFTQYNELRHAVPRVALTNTNSENSEYTNYSGNNKNCYLMFANALGENENCAYGVGSGKCHDCYDTVNVYESELVYDCTDSKHCHRVVGAVNCQNCTESWYLEDCSNCQNCVACKGLRNKQYCIFNKQYSAAEFAEQLKIIQLNTFSGMSALQKQWQQFRLTVPNRFSHQLQTENCTGDYIYNSVNCTTCFDVNETEQSKFIKFSISQVKESYDVSYTATTELGYDSLSLVDSYNCRFCNITWWSVRDLEYCELCFNSAKCFGSIGLRKQNYCILNKQYEAAEYHTLVKRIIEQMNIRPYVARSGTIYRYGEFPPVEHSPFTHSESVAEDYFPTTQSAIRAQSDQVTKLTDSIVDVVDNILQQTLTCLRCSKAYKLIPAELDFYRKMSLPIPRYCFNCRHQARLGQKNSIQLWPRQCMCLLDSHKHAKPCPQQFETTYSPERQEIVYCEQCYNQEMF
ncbi:MAG: hypothetical protein ACD_43C00015G0001 [uncultured bacterium]|nr:MAG: hypothetical protein ACD_43C00015G0001 [uncultured bacterium]